MISIGDAIRGMMFSIILLDLSISKSEENNRTKAWFYILLICVYISSFLIN